MQKMCTKNYDEKNERKYEISEDPLGSFGKDQMFANVKEIIKMK